MKLFHKIFLCFVVIFGIAFQAAGYLLINFAYENAIEQEKKIAFQDFQYNRYILQSVLYTEPDIFSRSVYREADLLRSLGNFTVPVAINEEDGRKTYYFSDMAVPLDQLDFCKEEPKAYSFADENAWEDGKLSFQIYEKEGKSYIFVQDYVVQDEKGLYLTTQTEITAAVHSQRNMIAYFQRIYMVILCISFPIIFFLTKALTEPLKRVSEAASWMAKGNYSQRIRAEGKDEISELASDFNQMARQVEEKIAELSDAARQKEDFTANFAHEMKTPLTSVIGYADMLYQRDLPREEVKHAAEYIMNEGMRLEALALKLMDLFVLDKQEFFLEQMPVREIFENLQQGIAPMCEKFGVALHMEMGEGSIWADFDLFKTMMLNLADNALKAGSRDLWIRGEQRGGQVWIEVRDNGKGIPKKELGRITEAFYMVDKSRSRQQHGAGLGLALVSKILEAHGAKMEIESDGETGTRVCIRFCSAEEPASYFVRQKGGKDEEGI